MSKVPVFLFHNLWTKKRYRYRYGKENNREGIVEERQIDLSQLDQLDHGNAWSLYFRDPEGNMLELYVETPWQLKHPFAQPFDIMQPDDVIIGMTCERVRESEGVDPWSAAAQKKMADA